jgi:hypothetical protein
MACSSRACAHFLVSSAVVVLIGALSARAETVHLAPLKDSVIFSESNNTNGGGEVIHVGANGSGNVRRGLMQFDIAASVPTGSTITAATLTLHLNDAGSAAGDRTVALYRILGQWGNGTTGSGGASGGSGQGFAPATGDVTWNYRSYSTSPPSPPLTPWLTAGGDFQPLASASLTFTPIVGNYYSWTGAGLVNDVQAWLDDPLQNFGWILRGEEVLGGKLVKFDSLERTIAEYRPVLTIEYTTVPEPSAFALLFTGLAMATVALRCRLGKKPSCDSVMRRDQVC